MAKVTGLRRSERIRKLALKKQANNPENALIQKKTDKLSMRKKELNQMKKKKEEMRAKLILLKETLKKRKKDKKILAFAKNRSAELKKKLIAIRGNNNKLRSQLLAVFTDTNIKAADIVKHKLITRLHTGIQNRIQSGSESAEERTDRFRSNSDKYLEKSTNFQRDGHSGPHNVGLATEEPWKFCESCDREYADEPGRVPRVLGCGHTFCEECIGGWFTDAFCQCPVDLSYSTNEGSMIATDTERTKLFPRNFQFLRMLSELK